MHIWTIEKWKKVIPRERVLPANRIRVYADRNVDPEVVAACRRFVEWAKGEYVFPLEVRIHLKGQDRIKAMDGDDAVGTFYEPPEYDQPSHIRIAAGDYGELVDSIGRDNALCTILTVLAHEMTHYFQWINDLPLTERGRERQATQYAHWLLSEYAQTREHP